MVRIAVSLLALITFASLAAGCGSGESKEDIASEVAKAWVSASIDEVADEVIELVVGEAPIVNQIAGAVLSDQIRDNLLWEYSPPKREAEDRYQVTATASVTLEIKIPILGAKTYAASLPFILDVDTDTEAVVRWVPDLPSARVGEET